MRHSQTVQVHEAVVVNGTVIPAGEYTLAYGDDHAVGVFVELLDLSDEHEDRVLFSLDSRFNGLKLGVRNKIVRQFGITPARR
jgi:hypothetical protein